MAPDPTSADPYDDLAQVYYTTVNVPANTARLVVETSSLAPDVDMYVGTGTTPSAGTVKCTAATSTAAERCDIANPVAGTYWILVQNFTGTGAATDVIDLWFAPVPVAVTSASSGNMFAVGPTTTTAGVPFSINVFWDDPAITAGDRWYGSLRLGKTPATPGNIGTIGVDLRRAADDVTKTANVANAMVGDTVTYTITVQPNVMAQDLSYTITDAIPSGLSYVAGSATASSGSVSVSGSTVTWNGSQTGTANVPTSYVLTTSVNDATCDTGFGGYVDLGAFGINPQSAVTGDTVRFTAFSTGSQFNFFGTNYTGLTFSDDGFAMFDQANNYAGSPWIPQSIPDANKPNNLLAMFWQDMEIVYTANTRGVSLATSGGTGATGLAIVEYDNVQLFGDPANQYDFELVARRQRDDTPGAFEFVFAYDNFTGDQSLASTIGIENAAGTVGIPYVNNAPTAITNGLMVCADAVTPPPTPVTITFQAVVTAAVAGQTVVNNAIHNTNNVGSEAVSASASFTVATQPDPLFSDGFE